MPTSGVAAFAEKLRARPDCECERGLTADEVDRAESTFRLTMPPVWRELLMVVHPIELPEPPRGPDGIRRWTRFPDWRFRDVEATRALINGPVDGLLFDVEHNGFWWRSWGPRPEDPVDVINEARMKLSAVPTLTPLWSHLYVASTDSSPVFSIVQADLYVPALAIEDFVAGSSRSEESATAADYPIGDVPFWSQLHAYAQVGHFTHFGELADGGL